ncbi:MAG: diguanylate cyclase [Chloroflexota bacterium]
MERSTPYTANILVVDDVQDNLDILEDLLTYHGYSVATASNGEEALARVHKTPPDLILLDIIMPRMDGYEVCSRLKADNSTRGIPVIFVSSLVDVQNMVRGFQVGGADYIVKPYQQAEVLARINTHLTALRLQKQLEEQNSKLESMANTDFLTGVNNRRRFFAIAETEFSGAIRDAAPASVTIFDVDNYKTVNDTHGHMVGDQVLSDLARLIFEQARDTDVTARYGGDEFVILHPLLDKQGAYQIAEMIRKKVEVTAFSYRGRGIRITVSAGVEDTSNCREGSRFDDVLAKADKALYLAKRSGRNRVIVFEENLV